MGDLLNQADQLMKDEKFHEALELYNQGILKSSDNALAYQGAALSWYKLKNMEKAIEMSKKALNLDSRLAFAHVILAEAYDELGEIISSRDEAKAAYQLNPESDEVLGCYGAFLVIDKKYKEAIPILEKAAKINPNNYNVHNNLAVVYLHKEDKVKVFEQAKEMYRLRPSLYTNIRLVIAYMNSKHIFNILSVVFLLATIGAFIFNAWSLLIPSFAYVALLITVGLILRIHFRGN